MQPTRSPLRGPAVLTAGVVLAGGAAAAALASDAAPGTRARFAVMQALIVLVPVGVGLYATRYDAHRRFGRQLIAAGLLWSAAALAQADASLPYSLGRVVGWIVTFALIFLVLAYPTGRLAGPPERAIAAASLAVLCVLYVPTALLVEGFPAQTPWSPCREDCPANAFMVLDHQPAFLEAWVLPLRDAAVVALFLATLAVVTARAVRASYVQRRTVVPALVAFGLQLSFLTAFVVVRRAQPGASAADTLGWLFALSVPAVALGFLAGLARWRIYVAGALQRLTTALRETAPASDLQATLATAVVDPTLEVAIRRDGGWVDATGRFRTEPVPEAGRAHTEVRDRDRLLAVLTHDRALADDREFASAVAACTAALLERRRTLEVVTEGLREIEALRTQMLAEVDDERRRIERDLHDGVQQRLVVLGIKLGMLSDRLAEGHEAAPSALRGLEAEVDGILDEIRSLARGVYPSLLADHGLANTLLVAADRAPLPVEVDAEGVRRHPQDLEAAVYFACLEALQNVIKHAHATGARIVLRDGDALTFEVDDDGAGFNADALRSGSGLAGMRERLRALGGTLTVESTPGGGTRVVGQVPVRD